MFNRLLEESLIRYQQSNQQGSAQSMLGVHASAQAIIHFVKVAQKHNLTGVCLYFLARIYSIPSVPIVDCLKKNRQQVKCYLPVSQIFILIYFSLYVGVHLLCSCNVFFVILQAAKVLGKNELQEGLEVY